MSLDLDADRQLLQTPNRDSSSRDTEMIGAVEDEF